jgi:HK97 family phage portal protein
MGLFRTEVRTVRPPMDPPNANDPATVPPATVGPPSARPGDPNGVQITVPTEPGGPLPPVYPAPWSGWPAEWDTPNWNGQYGTLVDTAWACLDLNASVLSSMPPYTTKAGVVVSSPSWMSNPDPDVYTSWDEFAKSLFWDYQLGEAFIVATARFADGWPARFHVIEPWLVNVEMQGGARRYTIGEVVIPDGDILHVRYKSTTSDARGHGPLEAGRSRLVAAGVLARYGTNLASSGGVPYYVLKHPASLTKDQADKLREQWWQSRINNLGEPAVLSGGVELETLQLSPTDMALLDLAQFNESRIAVLLGVPPFLVGLPSGGDSMTYSNVSALFDYHWRAGLRPKANAVMAALSQWALPRGTGCELNRDEYVRPGLAERAQAYSVLHSITDAEGPAITVAEIRTAERLTGLDAPVALTGGIN